MLRLFLIGAVVFAIFSLGAGLVGRAMGHEVQDRVIFTRDGVTFDCERRFVHRGEKVSFEDGSSVHASEDGEVFYTNCHTIP